MKAKSPVTKHLERENRGKRFRSVSDTGSDSEEEPEKSSRRHKKHKKSNKKKKEHKKSKKSKHKKRHASVSPDRSRSPKRSVSPVKERTPTPEKEERYRQFKDKVAEKPEWAQRRRFNDEPDVNYKGRGRMVR